VRPKRSVNGTRKQTKIEDTYKLTTMIAILLNTLLTTPKFKFYSELFTNFGGPPNPATTIFMGPN
jgi:hypothetical protein